MAPLLSFDRVGKSFPNGVAALDGASLDVEEGEFLSLVGASGCGKSTLLRLAAGLEAPTKGTVRWTGPIMPGAIGFVFQDPTLMPWARVADNVRLPLDLAGVPRREAEVRVTELLERVGLRDFASAYPRELSGGMRMRTALARVLTTRPRVLLMDEPFAALDEITRQRLNDDLLALWQEDRFTVLFVTHSVYESVYLSTRVAVMASRPGRVAADIPVGLPLERTPDLRTDDAYLRACRIVSAALAHAMKEAA